MKNDKYTFQKYSRSLIFRYAIIPIIVIVILLAAVVISVLRFSEKQRSINTNNILSERISSDYNKIIKFSDDVLNDERFGVYLGEDRRTANLMYEFYQLKNDLSFNVDIYVYENNDMLVETSNSNPEISFFESQRVWQSKEILENLIFKTTIVNRNIDQHFEIIKIVSGQEYKFIIDIDTSDLSRVLNQSPYTINVILGKYNQVISSNSQTTTSRAFKFSGTFNDNSRLTHDGEDFYYSISDIENLDLRLLVINKISPVSNISIILLLSLLGVSAITFLVVSIAWSMMNKKNENAINIMIQNIRSNFMKNRDKDDPIFEEFKSIDEDYRKMAKSIDELIAENKKITELSAVDQLNLMNSQFNPHFLFNSLESLRYLTKFDNDKADKYIVDLSRILRYTIDYKGFFASVQQEVEYLESYLKLLKIRYEDRLNYKIEIDDNAWDEQIPKLIIQPLVENSIKYTYRNQQNLDIKVNIYLEEDNIIINIGDNGPGVSKDRLREIKENMKNYTSKFGIGLYNINKKLDLLYKDYKFDMDSKEGLSISITLPRDNYV